MAIAAITSGLIVAILVSNSLNKKEKKETIVYDYESNPEVLDEFIKKI